MTKTAKQIVSYLKDAGGVASTSHLVKVFGDVRAELDALQVRGAIIRVRGQGAFVTLA